MEKVIFDTNAYRYLVSDESESSIPKLINKLKSREKRNNIQALMSSTVLKELLAHVANHKNPVFHKCMKAIKAQYLHCSVDKTYSMIASPELLISKAFFGQELSAKIETNKALGQIAYHLATNPSEYIFKKFQKNLNLNRDHILDTEQEFAIAMKKFVLDCDPNAKRWRIFENDEKQRNRVLSEIRSDRVSLSIALGYLLIVYFLLINSAQITELPPEQIALKAHEFVKIFPEPIALYKNVMENLVNSEFNILEKNRSNFVWDIHLMFNVGTHSIADSKLYFVTADKAMISATMNKSSSYSILTPEEYWEYLN